MEANVRDRVSKLFVGLLVVLFGAGSWLTVNGIWVELPVFVALGIPEGYNLASYLVVIIQLANIGPLVFTIVNHFLRGNKLEIPTIYLTLSAGVISCVLLVFFWDITTFWPAFGERSTALLCLSFAIALVNCTSSVTFIPFMVRLKSSYMTVFFVGQGFSALAPGLVALGQGVSNQVCIANLTYIDQSSGENCTTWMSHRKPANFPPETFFWFLSASMGLSLLAFLLLNILPVAKEEYTQISQEHQSPSPNHDNNCGEELVKLKEDDSVVKYQPNHSDSVPSEGKTIKKEKRSKREYAILFTILAVANALGNGVLPSIQTFYCGAYGFNAFLLAATLGKVANPVACFVVMFFPQSSLVLVTGMSLLGLLSGGYCLATTLLSPTPPLQDEVAGVVLVVIAWILFGGFFAYVKSTIGWILRNEPDNRKLLTWYGVITQLGSMVGAFIMFPLINALPIFVPYHSDPCKGFPTCE